MAAEPCYYHWRELPQAPFLSRQKFCHVTKLLCCLSLQNVCREKKKLSQQIFATTNIILSRQNDKHTFVAKNTCSVATKVCLLWQIFVATILFFFATNICRDKRFVATNSTKVLSAPASDSILLSREKIQSKLVATKQCLSRQKCREKYTFIATKNLSR